MTKLRTALTFLALALLASAASADTISGAYVGCVSKAALSEFTTAAVNGDYQQMQALTGTQCISIEGMEYSVVDRGWSRSQIRVYAIGSSALLWTVSEAVK